ncbi:MAG: hypothetical protein K8R02_06350 [Anaerohalosphaeraceae bacterium]|nr:hypothetical protein [Anaerohalosphaeraceae bacterium]
MRAEKFGDLLKKGDRVAVSNITGREASVVSVASQKYCANIVGGWALGKGGQCIEIAGQKPIPVFSNVVELIDGLPRKKHPNKILVYSPPSAVYGEVKEIVEYARSTIETLFIVTERVSVEVASKVFQLCSRAGIDVLGCNSLGMINVHDSARVGAVGGDSPSESFRKGSAAIISNSGNMVNTMASYLQSAGLGISYGISTGKDALILTPLKSLLELARDDERTNLVILYVEPGGLYEKEALELLTNTDYPKPVIAYVTGEILQKYDISLGHAGAVVEGGETTATAKMRLFDDYFGIPPFEPNTKYKKNSELPVALKRGIRISSIHHLPDAAALVYSILGLEKDFRPLKPLSLNPWFLDYKGLGKHLPSNLVLHQGDTPSPYKEQLKILNKEVLGLSPSRRNMRKASYASSNDGSTTRLYGHSIEKQMQKGSFVSSVLLGWAGEVPNDFEVELIERCLIASLSNGPGTISAQASKLSTSAGNLPNTAMIASLACIGDVHGGNGRRAVDYLIDIFKEVGLDDPYSSTQKFDLKKIVDDEVVRFSKYRKAAKEADADYRRIPCLGHPVFRNDPVNYDPRERIISEFLKKKKIKNVFLDYYHMLARALKEAGIAKNVWAVNLDGAIASVVLGIYWESLKRKGTTVQRVRDIAFMVFALGRAAGAGGEFLDHQDFGSPMDMRTPVNECINLSRAKD